MLLLLHFYLDKMAAKWKHRQVKINNILLYNG